MKCPDCGGPPDFEIDDQGVVIVRTMTGARCQGCGRVYTAHVEVDGLQVNMTYGWQDTAATALRRVCDQARLF